MRALGIGIVFFATFLLSASALLWAGNSKTIAVSCIIPARLPVQMEYNQDSTSGKLLQQKESKAKNIPYPYDRAIIYTYCER